MENKKEIVVSPAMSVDSPKELAVMVEVEKEKRKILSEYIKSQMIEGVDFGTIMMGGRETKPTLFKAGSEKFCSLFNIRPTFSYEHADWDKGVFAMKCELLNKKGEVVGEGRGVARLSEKQNWTMNNCLKIAEKRAQLDAVLRTGGLSDVFTQDLEDQGAESPTPEPKVPVNAPWNKPITIKNPGDPATDAQRAKIMVLAREAEVSKETIEKSVGPLENITKGAASAVIERLTQKLKKQEDNLPEVPPEEQGPEIGGHAEDLPPVPEDLPY